MGILEKINSVRDSGRKQLAVLADPDKLGNDAIETFCGHAVDSKADYIFVGGSLLTSNNLSNCIRRIRYACPLPVVLFPGNTLQIDDQADAILFLSLISGRNADLLIGNHVISAPIIREKKLEAIPTGYMLIHSGGITAVLYMSNTQPIPDDKPDIASCTAMAGEMLGMKLIFMDAGSGANFPVPEPLIRAVRKSVSVPVIVGGGIRTPEHAAAACKAGADLVVVGNTLEKDPAVIHEIAYAVRNSVVTV
jgi:putative glycerol-1-phosphate prenyltransferase